MKLYLQLSVFLCMFWLSSCQYNIQYRNPSPGPTPRVQYAEPVQRPKYAEPLQRSNYAEPLQRPNYAEPLKSVTPRPLILSHRQAQTHDGGFEYAFQTDNGLQQGETISPDGTRNGQYSYVDPHGQQITVKYTAGKDGFRILEGPHRTPESAPHVEQQQQHQPYQQKLVYQQTFDFSNDNKYQVPVLQSAPIVRPVLPLPRYVLNTNKVQRQSQKSQEYIPGVIPEDPQQLQEFHDEPGKPYSFGSGYSFEFSG